MGERKKTIFHVGCPGMDHIKGIDCSDISELKKYKGLGGNMDWSKPYILMIQHPITTSFGEGYEQIGQTLNAMRHFSNTHQIVVMWPNADAGSEDVAKGIRVFREKNILKTSTSLKISLRKISSKCLPMLNALLATPLLP